MAAAGRQHPARRGCARRPVRATARPVAARGGRTHAGARARRARAALRQGRRGACAAGRRARTSRCAYRPHSPRRTQRPGAARAHRAQPRRQCHPLHRARRRADRRTPPRRGGRDRRRRHRHRHSAGAPRAHLRGVLPGARHAHAAARMPAWASGSPSCGASPSCSTIASRSPRAWAAARASASWRRARRRPRGAASHRRAERACRTPLDVRRAGRGRRRRSARRRRDERAVRDVGRDRRRRRRLHDAARRARQRRALSRPRGRRPAPRRRRERHRGRAQAARRARHRRARAARLGRYEPGGRARRAARRASLLLGKPVVPAVLHAARGSACSPARSATKKTGRIARPVVLQSRRAIRLHHEPEVGGREVARGSGTPGRCRYPASRTTCRASRRPGRPRSCGIHEPLLPASIVPPRIRSGNVPYIAPPFTEPPITIW